MNKKWSLVEENYLKENVETYTDEELAHQLSKKTGKKFTKISIARKRQKLGLKKKRGRGISKLQDDTFLDIVYND